MASSLARHARRSPSHAVWGGRRRVGFHPALKRRSATARGHRPAQCLAMRPVGMAALRATRFLECEDDGWQIVRRLMSPLAEFSGAHFSTRANPQAHPRLDGHFENALANAFARLVRCRRDPAIVQRGAIDYRDPKRPNDCERHATVHAVIDIVPAMSPRRDRVTFESAVRYALPPACHANRRGAQLCRLRMFSRRLGGAPIAPRIRHGTSACPMSVERRSGKEPRERTTEKTDGAQGGGSRRAEYRVSHVGGAALGIHPNCGGLDLLPGLGRAGAWR